MEFQVVRETRQRVPAVAWRRLLHVVARGEGSTRRVNLSLILTTPKQIATLNIRYHHGHGPTDVLAFPAGEGRSGVGDIVLCPAILAKRNPGVPLGALLAHRFVHAVLHLHGYSHGTVRSAQRMEQQTRRYLARINPAWLRSLPTA